MCSKKILPSFYSMIASAQRPTRKWHVLALSILSLLIAFCVTVGPLPVVAQSSTNNQFLPFVVTDGFRNGVDAPGATECELTGVVLEIITLFLSDNEQNRPTPDCNPLLMQVAQARAADMAANGYFGHTNPAGKGPNLLAREAGYELPSHYSTNINANQIESIAAGYSSPSVVWQKWKDSSIHRPHVLGVGSFFQSQQEFGFGYIHDPDSQYKHYWVLLTAPPTD